MAFGISKIFAHNVTFLFKNNFLFGKFTLFFFPEFLELPKTIIAFFLSFKEILYFFSLFFSINVNFICFKTLLRTVRSF